MGGRIYYPSCVWTLEIKLNPTMVGAWPSELYKYLALDYERSGASRALWNVPIGLGLLIVHLINLDVLGAVNETQKVAVV